MSKARLVITAVIIEGRPVTEVATTYDVSRSWIYELVARYRDEGEAAFEPRSKRPRTSPLSLPATTTALIIEMRHELVAQGLDAGPHTIAWHLEHHHRLKISTASIWRHLKAAGLIEPEPKKRPRSSYIRFEAELPNECWQSDFTHWRLADGTDTEILTFFDDHSRYALTVTAHRRVTGPIVTNTFKHAVTSYGTPASTLTDNGMVFTTRLSGGKGRNGFETELVRLGIQQKNSRPNHPTTCGKVERFQQTLKKWLRKQPPATTITELQHHIDNFVDHYNHHRPHSSLPARATPATTYNLRPKATPGPRTDDPHLRVRHDRVDAYGKVSLRHNGRLHHIGIGRTHARTLVLLLIADLDIRIIDAATGELLRHLTLNPNTDYQPIGTPKPQDTPN